MRPIARFTYVHAWRALAGAFVLLALAAVVAASVFDEVEPFDINDPDSEGVQAALAVAQASGSEAAPGVVLLVTGEGGPVTRAQLSGAARSLRSVPGIGAVAAPSTQRGELISEDRMSGLVLGYLERGAGRVEVGEVASAELSAEPGILVGGTAVAAFQVGDRSENDAREIELYAAPVLFLMLLIVFRTVVAALLPLLVAGFTIALTLAALRLLTELIAIDLFSLQVVTGLGVGLAIDYSLFALSRYREELARGRSYPRAHAAMLDSAGRTVAYSSITVATALIALVVFPQPFLSSTGIAGALTALFAGATALLVLPAALAILGPSVDTLPVRADPLNPKPSTRGNGSFWERLPRLVCRRPLIAILAGGLTVLAMASQSFGITLTTPDARELPSSDSARVVADRIGEFPGVAPTLLFAVVPEGASEGFDPAALETLAGVTSVSDPEPLGADSARIDIAASVDPLSDEGQELVAAARAELPFGSLLGGRAVELTDQRSSVGDHAPIAIVIVIVTALIILLVMTRSVVLPLLALALNIVTVAASLGLMKAMFANQWLAGLLGTDAQEQIDISVPVLAFAVIFGISTDYGIFLLARIREARPQAETEPDAIVAGVAATGRLITASAVLFATAVGAFAFSDLVIIKQFAVVIAIAVLLDATVIRGLLIPALLSLLGRWAWACPGWLQPRPR